MLDIALHTGIEHPDLLWILVPTFLSFVAGAVLGANADLLPVIEVICEEYGDAELARLSSFAPLAEIMGMHHERADRRLFMS